MIAVPGAEEIGKTTRSFFDALKDQPLSLALVVVILALCAMLYYTTSQTLEQRRQTAELVIGWQRDTDKLMANCVSKEVTDMMLNNVQKITETMLANTQMEIARMQVAIESERVRNQRLTEQMLQMIRPAPSTPPIEHRIQCDPKGPFCMPP